MKKIVVIPNPTKDIGFDLTVKVISVLQSFSAEVYVPDKYRDIGKSLSFYSDFPSDADLIVVIGGDGSVLDASVYAISYGIPLLGVNLGKVGYLNEIEPDNLDALSALFSGCYTEVEKMLLSVSLCENGKIKTSPRLAVNDIVISHEDYLGIADFTVVSNEGGVKYRADGAIISTPQGSTAYSLSAGGPIISHEVNALVLTPICPHSFFNRPIIFSADESIKISNTGAETLNISIDGRRFATIAPGGECTVSVSEKKLKFVTFKKNNMFSALFHKIKTLEDIL